MSLYSYNPSDRYRRKRMHRQMSVLGMLCVLGGAVGVGYWFGVQVTDQTARSQEQQLRSLQDEHARLLEQVTQLGAQAQTAEMRYAELQKSYESVVPQGPVQDLLTLMRQRLEEGMDPARLAFVIRSTRPPTNCSAPVTKRFVVKTPNYDGPDSELSLAEGAILISGDGQSAKNEGGAPEAWFDPAWPVTLRFKVDGAEQKPKSGPLPLQYSVVQGGREYRFTFSEGAKSFIKVVYDSCDYP